MKQKFFSVMASCLACFVLVAGLAGCGESEDLGGGDGGSGKGKSIKLQKLDLNGAKYLTLVNDTRASGNDEVGLFKIDEQGNMTTVVLSCTEEEDGTVTRTRTDIKVTPREMRSLGGLYTVMSNCSFTNGDGNNVYLKQYYEPESTSNDFCILVRHADGAIFYIPDVLVTSYFSMGFMNDETISVATDEKGNLYMFGYNHDTNNSLLGQLTIQNGQLVMKQINPNGVSFGAYEVLPIGNGTLMTLDYPWDPSFSYTFFYPNGGFENYNGKSDGVISVTKVKSGMKAVVVNEVEHEGLPTEYIVSLHDFIVGTSYGSHSLSEPLASLSSGTDYSLNYNDPDHLDWLTSYLANSSWLQGVYETTNNYIIGQKFIVDKRTMDMRVLEGTESYIIFPNDTNMYKGLAWNVGSWGAEWFDIETMQYGKVDFNLPGDIQINKTITDIPSGKFIISGVRYTDGKSVTYFIDIETGNYTCTETDSERPITALIPLN